MSNVTSLIEDSLTVRLGSLRFPNTANIPLIHSMAKLKLGGADSADPRYVGTVGAPGNIYRVTGPYTTFVNVTNNPFFPLPVSRWEYVQYNAGTSGNPSLFFASLGRMMKDDGTFTPLHKWGYLPPVVPPTLGLGNPLDPNSIGLVIGTTQSGGSARLAGQTLSSATAINGNYYQFVPTAMTGIVPGIILFIGSAQILVDTTDDVSFYGYSSTLPSGAITSFFANITLKTPGGSTVFPSVADGSQYYGDYFTTADWSLSGIAANGYSSNDNIHVGVNVSDIADVSKVELHVYVNGSGVDYYTATIPVTSGGWFETDIMKSTFTTVGLAGSGPYSWKNVSKLQVLVTSNTVTGSPTFTVEVGSIYAIGNQGPNSSASAVSTAYDYLYTYRNPNTGAESNPCVAMVSSRAIDVQNRAVQVTVYGTSIDPQVGQPDVQGFGSIAVYRRGGVFADGYYRFVGYSTNPGAPGAFPLTAVFTDNQTDDSIITNRLVAMDNYPPVVSNLPIPFAGVVSTVTLDASGFYEVFLINYPGYGGSDPLMSTFFDHGSTITIGAGNNREDCIVVGWGTNVAGSGNWILVYLQNTHFAGDQVTCSFKVGQPADIVCAVGDSILVAGDPFNPQVVSKSKTGQPEAFPVLTIATGIVNQMNIGSPSNPIKGLVEYNGEVVSLNLSAIYTFYVIQGQMSQPYKTPANRGMWDKHCYCKVDNAIWYLSYDGIYAWSGGGSVKVSEGINSVFIGPTLNGFFPLDYSQTASFSINYYQNYIWILYRAVDTNQYGFKYSMIYNRWEPIIAASAAAASHFDCLLVEDDTGRLIAAVYENANNRSFLYRMEAGTTEGHSLSSDTDGTAIDWSFTTPNYDMGDVALNKQFTDIVVEFSNVADTITVEVFINNATAASDTFTLATGSRRPAPLPFNIDGNGYANGWDAYSVSFRFSGSATQGVTLYSIQFYYNTLAAIQQGRIMDWTDAGHPYDKRFYEVTIEYNVFGVTAGIPVVIDTTNGIAGNAYNAAVQTITLKGAGRSKQTFAVNDGIIAKMIRIRAKSQGNTLEIFGVFWHKEDYPADTTLFSEYTDKGYPFLKLIQQIVLDVNTNNKTIPVNIETDGTVGETVNVTSTLATRNQVLTLNPAIPARKLRYRIDPTLIPTGGQFQLFSLDWVVQPADKGPVGHSFGWDDLGHPYDKKLRTVTLEWEGAGAGVIINVDTLTGIDGGTQNLANFTLTLTGDGRSKKTFPISNGKIVKMIKVEPATNPLAYTFKLWGYSFTKDDYPADTIVHTAWDDFGYEHRKIIQEIAFDVDTANVAASVQVVSDEGTTQTISVTSTNDTREHIVTLNPEIVGKKFQLLIAPGTNGKFQLFGWKPKFEKEDPGPVSHSFSWDDLGHPYDKHMRTVTFEWQNAGFGVTMQMDTLSGIDGGTEIDAAVTFTLTGDGRSKKTFGIPDGIVCKMVRFRPSGSTLSSTFGIWGYLVTKEEYPADTVYHTPWQDFGYEHEKIIQEVAFDVDTGGVQASVIVQGDQGQSQTVTVTSTTNDRERIVTLNPQIVGKKFRLLPAPGTGGKFQLFNWKPKFVPNDPGAVEHSFSWDDLGWPYDKRLETVVIEYDVKGSAVTLQMDTISGDGTVHQVNVQQFVLSGPSALAAVGRSKVAFPINDGVVVKMVKIYPISDTVLFQMWGYKFQKIDYPADTVLFTDWENLGYGCEKVFRVLTIDVDTGGIPATVQLQVDGVTRYTFVVNTTSIDRRRIITLPSAPTEIIGKMVRLLITPSAGGKFQLFNKEFEVVREPCAVTQIDTLSIVMGQAGWKYLKQIWLEYMANVSVNFSIYRDNNQLFYTSVLPPHAYRDVERFYLPNQVAGILNKSKRYRFLVSPVDGTTPFKFYYDGSRIEYRALAGDQRTAYQQFVFSETLSPAGSGN